MAKVTGIPLWLATPFCLGSLIDGSFNEINIQETTNYLVSRAWASHDYFTVCLCGKQPEHFVLHECRGMCCSCAFMRALPQARLRTRGEAPCGRHLMAAPWIICRSLFRLENTEALKQSRCCSTIGRLTCVDIHPQQSACA